MKETKLLGTLLPSHPDLQPIIQELRKKYKLAEISPDDDPIEEIYLEDKIIPLEDFRKEIFDLVTEKVDFLETDSQYGKLYKKAKLYLEKPLELGSFRRLLPKKILEAINGLYDTFQKLFRLMKELVDKQNQEIADIIYIYMLTGETQEAPADWLRKVGVVRIDNEPLVFVLASQFVDPDVMVQQFREQYAKTFGRNRPKITKTHLSTAHYLGLKRMKKPWDYIVGEYVRLNNFSLPRDKASPRYSEVYRMYEARLKKRMQRTKTVLDVITRDIK